MKKTSDRVEAARRVIPAAGDIVATAVDRVGPLAQSAADRVGPLTEAATAALGVASGKVSPVALQAAAVVSPYTTAAIGAVTPLAQQAAERLTPLADSAKLLGGQAAHGAAERFGPAIEEALDRVGPAVESAVESAREKVSADLLPKLSGALTAAAGAPIVTEAVSRGQATLAAARGDLTLPPPKKARRWPKRVGIVAGVAAVAYVLARKLLGSQDSDWQAARPTTPYAPPTPASNGTGPIADASIFATDQDEPDQPSDAGPSEAGDDPQSGPSAHSGYLEANGEAEPDQPAEGGVSEAEADLAPSEPEPSLDPTEPELDATEPELDATEPELDATEPELDATEMVSDLTVSDRSGSDLSVSDLTVEEADTLVTEPTDQLTPAAGEPSDVVDVAVAEPEMESDPTVLIEPDDTVVMAPVPVPEPTTAGASGAGVHRGAEPPEGFTIKGNERSMKYHLPDSDGYVRTIAEVWFDSEEAAQAAGFTSAQR